jgi:hypothetical protein
MRTVATFHVLLLIVVYIIDRKHRRSFLSGNKALATTNNDDAVRDTTNFEVHSLLPYALLAVPLYMIMTNNAALAEHVLVMYTWYTSVRSVQIVLNKNSRPPIEYTGPLMVMSMLLLMYNNYIPITQVSLAYAYMLLYAFVVLMVYPKKTTSSSIIDDFILSHLMFYIFK